LKKAEGQEVSDRDLSIGKIRSITIQNFKGIKSIESLDVNADIMLITGPNGNGKSSFIEALTMALTGFHPETKKDMVPPDHFFHYGANQSTVEIKDNYGKTIKLQATREKNLSLENVLEIKRKQISTMQKYYEKGSSKLLFRLTSFLPEHVRLLFDEEATNKEERKDEMSPADVLIDLFEPLPMEIKTLRKVLSKEQEKIDKDIEKIETERSEIREKANYLNQYLPAWSKELVDIINPLLQALDRKEVELPPIKEKDTIKIQVDLLNNLKQQLEESLSTRIDFSKEGMNRVFNEIERKLEDKYGDIDLEELHEKEKELLEERERIEKIQRKGAYLGNKYLTELYNIFKPLADRSFLADCDQTISREAGFNDIVEEIRLIDPDKAKRFKNVVEVTIKESLGEKIDQINNELEKIKRKIENARKYKPYYGQIKGLKSFIDSSDTILKTISSFLDLYKRSEFNKEDVSQLKEKKRQVEELESFLDNEQRLSKEFMETFNNAINSVLKRFAMTKGLESVTIDMDRKDSVYKIHAKEEKDNKRGLKCFSLGQRAQIGLAWMAASRELVENSEDIDFPHRAIVLDDPTATFDMTNLLSHVLLCRQLAYHPDPAKRYQLFIPNNSLHGNTATDYFLK